MNYYTRYKLQFDLRKYKQEAISYRWLNGILFVGSIIILKFDLAAYLISILIYLCFWRVVHAIFFPKPYAIPHINQNTERTQSLPLP